MLFVTVIGVEGRSKRQRIETDDPAEAAAQAVASFLAGSSVEGKMALGILVEKQGTQIDRGELAEELEVLRTAEVGRARG